MQPRRAGPVREKRTKWITTKVSEMRRNGARMRRFFIFASALLTPGIVHSQAFGVRSGAPVSEYGGRAASASGNPFFFEIKVPQPNREFEAYYAWATPET